MNRDYFSRRQFCGRLAAFGAAGALVGSNVDAFAVDPLPPTVPTDAHVGQKFKPWSPGCLDLHHISTGRGSAMLSICPDGTVMMVDAGAIYDPLRYTIAPKPDGSRRPGEWLARYVSRHLTPTGYTAIDHLLISHLHADHIGQWSPSLPKSEKGDYYLTGVMDLAEKIPIRKLIDRGYPDYSYPPAASYLASVNDRLTFDNYKKYIDHRSSLGEAAERFICGTTAQLKLVRAPDKYPQFNIRNLAANGEVWTGTGEHTQHRFPDLRALPPKDYPTENMCSTAIRIQYGRFSYYTGGDLPNDAVGSFSNFAWQDIASPVARVAGPVSVAVANHHGYVDSMGPDCVRALSPRVFIIQGWDSAHPTIRPLYNMLSRDLYEGDRDIFSTAVKEENIIATRDLSKLKSLNGHVVIRVPEGGESFTVQILDNTNESDSVIAAHGPYPCV